MAEEPEVIQHELEETRHALAEKLEQIGEKISGTVETVSETVSSVTETVSNVTEAVEGTVQAVAQSVSGTVESVKETVETVGEKAAETVEKVKEAFNLSDQIRRRPWLWFGGSVATGFIAGKIFAPRRDRTSEAANFVSGRGYYENPAETRGTEEMSSSGNGRGYAAETTAEPGTHRPSWISSVAEHFGPELNRLKELALGTLFGVTRDMVAKAVPATLKDQVTNLVDDFTEKVGGKPIHGSILPESNDEESGQGSESQQGAEQEQSAAKTEQNSGSTERKSKETAGKSHRR